jgi:hypothetical protein
MPDRESALSVISEMQRRTPSRLIMREGRKVLRRVLQPKLGRRRYSIGHDARPAI